MNTADLATAIIIKFSVKNNKTEYEVLLYEQACRFMESMFQIMRENFDESKRL